MEVKPADFVSTILGFLEILLPGGMIAFLLRPYAATAVFGGAVPAIEGEAQGWVAFLAASYVLGHAIFLIGSGLDDLVYDRWRNWRHPKRDDAAYLRAESLKQQAIGEADLMNAYQWSKSVLILMHPDAIAVVRRHESDSKFFRSLVVVLIFAAGTMTARGSLLAAGISLALAVLSFFLYADQRWKSTQAAYRFVIAAAGKSASATA